MELFVYEHDKHLWLILNTDGAVNGSSGQAGGGELIRDENQKMVVGWQVLLEGSGIQTATWWNCGLFMMG